MIRTEIYFNYQVFDCVFYTQNGEMTYVNHSVILVHSNDGKWETNSITEMVPNIYYDDTKEWPRSQITASWKGLGTSIGKQNNAYAIIDE